MTKAGFWTTAWVTVVCVAGGARLVGSSSHASSHASESDLIAKAHRLGVPIDPSAIPTAAIPPDQNAAVIYAQIGQEMDVLTQAQRNVQLIGVRSPADLSSPRMLQDDERMRKDSDAALAQLQPVFQLADQLASRPKCEFSPEGPAPDTSKTTPPNAARLLAQDLSAKADSQDRNGDWTGALKTLRLASRVALDAGMRPGFSGLYTGTGAWGTVRRAYEAIVQRHSSDLKVLDAVSAQYRDEAPRLDLRAYLAATTVQTRTELPMINSMKDLRQGFGTGDSADDVLTTNFLTGPRLREEVDTRLLASWIDLWPKLPKDPTDWRGYRRVLKQANDTVQADSSALNELNQMQFSLYVGAADRVGEIETLDHLLLDSIALLKVRAQTGKLPVILPESMGAARFDSLDGSRLQYRRHGTEFVLYSVGTDGIDHGGRKRQPNDPPDTKYDIVESFR